jgi:hypothetical protein
MRIESVVGHGNKPFVKLTLADARLVARHEQYGLPHGIEGEGHAPDAISGAEGIMPSSACVARVAQRQWPTR